MPSQRLVPATGGEAVMIEMMRRILSRCRGHARSIVTYGIRNWLAIIRGGPIVRLTTRYAQYPLECRLGTSDLSIFRQVFIKQEYKAISGKPRLILDCGANVGYAAAYFLTRYPQAQVVAIEPDLGNYELLVRNLAPYGDRARVIRGAVWSHATRLGIAATNYRGGEECARQVRVCGPDEPETFPAFSVSDLVRTAGWEHVDLLKMDIEGAEAVVFARGHEEWIDRVRLLVMELHDDTTFGPATGVVTRATKGFVTTQSGELTLYSRPMAA
jgi:FkbM family methyltransferase